MVDPNVLVSALAVIIAAATPKIIEQLNKQPLSRGKYSHILGRWTGEATQKPGLDKNAQLQIKVDLILKSFFRNIYGHMTITYKDKTGVCTDKFKILRGGVYFDYILQFMYFESDGRKQLGAMSLKLDEYDELILQGCYSGYGPKSKGIVVADVELKKDQNNTA